jgi:hypothetical protein
MAINWAKKLKEAGSSKEIKPEGNDWFTIHDLKRETGKSVTNCYVFVKEQISEGKLEKFKGSKYSNEHKQLTKAVWYRFT